MSNFKFQISNLKFISIGYLLTIVGLFLYSFTQVDLSLTLSQWSYWQVVQKFFQQIGYFNRPLSTGFYSLIIFLLFVFYGLHLIFINSHRFKRQQLWILIIATGIILSFSYNAFSHDLFNYIFDAKIVTYYQQNPYTHKALDFPNDPMLSFMHWTHRFYPYGPFWLVLTIPLSFIGLNFFLPTFFLFKFLMSLGYLGTAYFIEKILIKVSPKESLFGLAFFAFNPLIIIEGLVSSHNDILMMFFAIFSLFLFLNKKNIFSWIGLGLSAGIKFATGLIFPVYLASYFFYKKRQINFVFLINLITVMMVGAVVVVSIRTNFQPWYLLLVIPFVSLTSKKYYILIPVLTMSFFSLSQYIPFLLKGDWNYPVPQILFWLTSAGIILSLALTGAVYALNNIVRAKK
ncbi:MAG: DUF2029 domain-containing protein [Candidatus Levybacteria bacterium]|nr:DUF2029 domain-containing protein [Candidatus Levybacteria bacterium]